MIFSMLLSIELMAQSNVDLQRKPGLGHVLY